MTPQEAWDAVLGELQMQLHRENFKKWLQPTRAISLNDDTFLIAVPNTFYAAWLDQKWRYQIKKTVASVLGRELDIKFQIGQQQPGPAESQMTAARLDCPQTAVTLPAAVSNLVSRYTFGNFVVSNNNILAHSAALDVAQNPGQTNNPLFIYGGCGLGKTHLLQAIGHTGVAAGLSVLYSSAEQFTNDYVASLRCHTVDDFRSKYQSPDILLVDDIPFLCGKERTQETFFHTFNERHNASRQIVICSDRPPKSLTSLEDRLISRFEWGIVVGIAPPDVQGRLDILKSKSANLPIAVPDDALKALARIPFRNIRELEGSLNKVTAMAKLSHQAPTGELVDNIFRDIRPAQKTEARSPEKIVEQVARYYDVTPQSILSKKGGRSANTIRHVTLYLLREECQMSLSDISNYLGYKDHTSVSYGLNKITSGLSRDQRLKETVHKITEDLHTATA
ncbi:MAG: chromosomal replication initiator protein DnaA [Chloroflexi bacterium]|nr:chromosomal replication initiator protein DnaA [Chloroflexota bacterium]